LSVYLYIINMKENLHIPHNNDWFWLDYPASDFIHISKTIWPYEQNWQVIFNKFPHIRCTDVNQIFIAEYVQDIVMKYYFSCFVVPGYFFIY
jgi:hypothetical protein